MGRNPLYKGIIYPAVYRIFCIAENKSYVGSTKKYWQRQVDHLKRLRFGNHENKYLQAAYNQYGLNNIQFEILELCGVDELLSKEQIWMDKIGLDNLYNIGKYAISRKGIPHTEETKKHLSKVQKGRPANSGSFKKGQKQIPGSGIAIVEFKIVSPEGVLYYGKNLHRFALANNLPSANLSKMTHGYKKHGTCHGWRMPNQGETFDKKIEFKLEQTQ